MQAKEPICPATEPQKPLLLVDVDGVISLFGGWARASATAHAGAAEGDEGAVEGSFHSIEGIPHFLSSTAAAHLLELARSFELVWASGWEERADEHLPHLLGLPPGLPFLCFERDVGGRTGARAHWKLEAIDSYAGGRPLAWLDDALDDACHAWARARSRATPTLLVPVKPTEGLTAREARQLREWARALGERPRAI